MLASNLTREQEGLELTPLHHWPQPSGFDLLKPGGSRSGGFRADLAKARSKKRGVGGRGVGGVGGVGVGWGFGG